MQLTQEQEAESVFFQSLDPSQNYESTNELAVSATCGELRIALKKALSMQSEEVERLREVFVALKKWMPHEYTEPLPGGDPCKICGVFTNGLHHPYALPDLDWVPLAEERPHVCGGTTEGKREASG